MISGIELMNHSFGGGQKGKPGSKGQENDGDLHIINQLRKIIDMETPMEVYFLDKSNMEVNLLTAAIVMEKYDSLRTSIQKEKMMNEIWASSSKFSKKYSY
jgi:hypothetical protein